MWRRATLGALAVMLADACGNQALAPGAADAAPPVTTDAAPTVDAPATVDATIVEAGAPDQRPATSCAATCDTPAGTVAVMASLAEAKAAVIGRWSFCSGQGMWTTIGAPADAVGVQLRADGTGSYLVAGPGRLVAGAGMAYALRYEVVSKGSTPQINLGATAGWPGVFRYSPCPRELEVNVGYGTPTSVLVPVDGNEEAPAGAPLSPADEPAATGGELDPTCALVCDPAYVPPTRTPTVEATVAALRGRWRFCSERETWQTASAPDDAIGVEFGEAAAFPPNAMRGKAYYLIEGPGGPARGRGFEYQLEYSITPDGSWFQFGITAARRGGGQGRVDVSACPALMAIWGGLRSTLVKL